MADMEWRTFLLEAEPELCAQWGDEQWALFFAKLDKMGSSGFLTAAAARFFARAVMEENPPRSPETNAIAKPKRKRRPAKKIHPEAHLGSETSSLHDVGLALLPTTPAIDDYLADVRKKFEMLIGSRHRQTVSAFIEVLYRDIVFLDPANAADANGENPPAND